MVFFAKVWQSLCSHVGTSTSMWDGPWRVRYLQYDSMIQTHKIEIALQATIKIRSKWFLFRCSAAPSFWEACATASPLVTNILLWACRHRGWRVGGGGRAGERGQGKGGTQENSDIINGSIPSPGRQGMQLPALPAPPTPYSNPYWDSCARPIALYSERAGNPYRITHTE